jgi:hypothetical protein
MRFWRQGVIAVGLSASVCEPSQKISDDKATAAVLKILQSKISGSMTVAHFNEGASGKGADFPAFVRLSSTATLFLEIRDGGQPINDHQLKLAVDTLNGALSSSDAKEQCISGVSPDWLTIGGTGSDYIGGSPDGGFQSVSGKAPNCPATPLVSTSVVYVLDTVTSFKSTSPSLSQNCVSTLSSSMTMDTSSFNFEDEGSNDWRLKDVKGHGVFISALIHVNAPAAKIHLKRVLNNYGRGAINNLIGALGKIYGENPPQGTYINLSLTVVPPLDCVGSIWQHVNDPSYATWWQGWYSKVDPSDGIRHPFECQSEASQSFSSTNKRLYVPLEQAIGELLNRNYKIIAAAGNDSDQQPKKTLGADLPAAFCGVTAVAATRAPGPIRLYQNNPGIRSNFSNAPHPSSTGCLGANPNQSSVHEELVVLGENVCSFYPKSDGTLGFAIWDGTSFATAITTGDKAGGTGASKTPCT